MHYPRPKAILLAHFSRFFFALALVFNIFFSVSYAPAEETFPVYQVIRPNVVFWEKIYGHYHSRQAILHDRNNLNIIYTVVELVSWEVPGSDRINQKMIKLARRQIKNILYELGHGKPPTSLEEKRIAALFPKKRHTTYLKARDNIRLQIGQKDRFQEGVIGSGRYLGRIKKIFRQYGLPGELAYIPHVESSFTTHARSKAGATGLWQFTRSTGKEFLTINEHIDERLDPFASTHAAARLLRENYAQLGNWPLAITAYNYGRAGMVRAMKEHKTYPDIFTHYKKGHFKFASRNFYSEFLAAHRVANRLEQNPKIIKDRPEATITFRLQGDASSITLRKFFQISKKDFARLNPALKQPLLDGTSPIPAGYPVELPATKRTRLKKKQWKESMYVSGEHDGKTYTVKRGDSLSTIAKKHKTTVKQLQALNDLDSAALIQVNQKLLLPSSGNTIILKNNPKEDPIKRIFMDISQTIKELKKRPDFRDNVGMILIHNGTVRNWSRADKKHVVALETQVDQEKIESLRQEYRKKEGIYEIIVETHSGQFQPGDDLLFIIVAGDLRENVKPVLAELLDRIKAEAVTKKEITD